MAFDYTAHYDTCPVCHRMVLRGQQCRATPVCDEPGEYICDCTHDGNRTIVGPKCLERIKFVWATTMEAYVDE